MNVSPDERPDTVHFTCPMTGLKITLVAGNYPSDSMNACVLAFVGNSRPFIIPVDAVVDVWNSYSKWMDKQEEEGEDFNFWNKQLEKLNFEGGDTE